MNVDVPRLLLLAAGLALWSGAALPLAAADPPASSPMSRLVFTNDDHLHGHLHELDSRTGHLKWRYPGVDQPFAFDLDAVSRLILPRGPAAPPAGDPAAADSPSPRFHFTLANGDTLTGTLQRLDAENLTLTSTSAPPSELSFPRRYLTRLEPAPDPADLLYQGPSHPNEWQVGYRGKNWVFDDGHLVSESYSSTGRMLPFPERARFEIDVSLRDAPTLNLFLCADNPHNGGDSYYYLQLTPNQISCQRYWRDHPRTYINLVPDNQDASGPLPFPVGHQIHLAVEIDRPARTLQIFLNGRAHGRFHDPSPKAPAGGGVILASYGNGAVRVSDLRLYALENLTPLHPDRTPPGTQLRSGDLKTGLLTFQDGSFAIDGQSFPASDFLRANLTTSGEGSETGAPSPPSAQAGSEPPLHVFLRPHGRLSGHAQLTDPASGVDLEHPWLGTLHLPWDHVDGFARAQDASPTLPSGGARFHLKNGDRLTANVSAWDDTAGWEVLWNPGPHQQSVHFPPTAVARVLRHSPSPLEPAPTLVHLASSDRLPGSLREMSPTAASLVSELAEMPLTIPMPAVRQIDFIEPQSLRFHGPGPLDAWKPLGNGAPTAWRQGPEGALITHSLGGLARDLPPMPERGQLDLVISWTGQLDLSLTLFAEDLLRPTQPESYRWHCENERISLHRGLSPDQEVPPAGEEENPAADDDPLRNRRLAEQLERFAAQFGGGAARRLGSPVPVSFKTINRARTLTFCWDPRENTVVLLVDGQWMRTWQDPHGLPAPRSGFILRQQSQSGEVRLLDMHLREWNGVIPEPAPEEETLKKMETPLVRLRNQDVFQADTLTLDGPDAPLTLASDLGPLAIPRDRLAHIYLPRRPFPVEPAQRMVVDAHIAPQGFSRFYLEKIEGDLLTVSSPYFGDNTFRLDPLSKLECDLQDRAFWDAPIDGWPLYLPVSMRSPSEPDPTTSPNRADPSRFNESVEFDE